MADRIAARFDGSSHRLLRRASRRSGKILVTVIATLAAVALVVVGYKVLYHGEISALERGTQEEGERQFRLTGLGNPKVQNTLDARYKDADGDLIADAPTDPAKQADPPVLRFSYIPQDDNSEFQAGFQQLLAALSKATGKAVVYQEFTSTEDELLALRDGGLEIAGFNTGAVPIAVCAAGFVPVSQMADANGNHDYQMEIIVKPDSPIKTIQDLRGRELTLTEPTSNSGYKAPLVMMRENGMVPPRDYLLRFSQGHKSSIMGIKNKQFEAAAVANDVLKREVADGHIGTDDFRSVFKSEQNFPSAALGYASDLKPDLAAKIKTVLLNFDWKGTGLEKQFAGEGKSKFVPASYKADWEYVRRIDDSMGFVYELKTPTTKPAS